MTGRNLDGLPLTIRFDTPLPTVLYYFSAECGWCERNWANIEALRARTDGRVRIIGVAASTAVPAYMKNLATPLPIVTSLPEATRAAYGFSGTPHTVVVTPDGRVAANWLGAWDEAQARRVSEFFGVPLPGLSPKVPRQ